MEYIQAYDEVIIANSNYNIKFIIKNIDKFKIENSLCTINAKDFLDLNWPVNSI